MHHLPKYYKPLKAAAGRLVKTVKKHPWRIAGYAAIFLCATLLAFLFLVSRGLPTIEEINSRQFAQSTRIYDREGETLLYEISGGEKRAVVPFEDIPQYLKDAVIAIEDQGFYTESGVSIRGIFRALLANLMHGRVVQGASTITQQLARNAFLSSEQTITRKIREALLAIRLDRNYPKDKILWLYLNEVPYGPTIYGAEAAARAYFHKPAKSLTLAESALLAAVLKAPSYYSPWGSHTKELFARQSLVLAKMRDTGKISATQFNEAVKTRLVFEPKNLGLKAPHFVFAVQDYLAKKYGEDLLERGGLRVVTTLDTRLEDIAERVVKEGAERNEKLYGGKNAALVAEDPKTGQILAMAGSRDYFDTEHEGNFNVATQGLRQPGSALKPFVYLTAFKKGYAPDTVLFDVPTEFSANPVCPAIPDFSNDNAKCFHPENFDGQFRGPVSLKAALAQSVNVPAVKTLYLVGIGDALSTLDDFGVTTLTDPRRYGLSLVLGGGEVKLVELVGAYGTLAQEGVRHERAMILEVKNGSGEVLEHYDDKNEKVMDAQYPRLITSILSDTQARAPLYGASLNLTVFPDREVALKTGTTNNYRDAWAFGYTPSLVAGVWAGNNDNTPMERRGSSILAAVPIWHAFLEEALKLYPSETFTRPAPTYPEKPILGGDYLAGNQIHTILYYVDKKDPSGPPPADPSADSQFSNWETGVLAWARGHIENFSSLNQLGASPLSDPHYVAAPGAPRVEIKAPQAGSYMANDVFVGAQIESSAALANIRVYWNGGLVHESPGNYPQTYYFSASFSPPSPSLQNLLEVEAMDAQGRTGRAGVVVYK